MIDGRITTYRTEARGFLYIGNCVVSNETVTAGTVMCGQVPDGPAKGFMRMTHKWHETQDADKTRCEFEIEDRRLE